MSRFESAITYLSLVLVIVLVASMASAMVSMDHVVKRGVASMAQNGGN